MDIVCVCVLVLLLMFFTITILQMVIDRTVETDQMDNISIANINA